MKFGNILMGQSRFFRTLTGSLVGLILLVSWAIIDKEPTARGQGLPDRILVLGVIADSRPQKGVALVKAEATSITYAVRVGQELKQGVVLESVERDYVSVTIQGRLAKIKVGEFFNTDRVDWVESAAKPLDEYSISEGIERKGNEIIVSSTLREYVSGPSLSKILMQAAAVPQYLNGELKGFGLFEIEKDSIFEKAGFKNGDVIMAINSQHLTNVGHAIKVLHSLKTENEVEVELVRDGLEQKLMFRIQ